jgi:hypothetical protein
MSQKNIFLNIYSIVFTVAVLFLFSCSMGNADKNTNGKSDDTLIKKDSVKKQTCTLKNDTTVIISGFPVDIALPEKEACGTILVLNGWNFSRDHCCKNCTFCDEAKAKGFRLIMPEMGLSVYSDKLYPETRNDWRKYPTRTWVIDTLITYMQKHFNLLVQNENNFLYGISTGSRGVALIALHTKNIFRAGAALSGDYDQTLMKNDNLMKGFYGNYNLFPERWEGDENPYRNASKYTIPVYFGHGLKDKVVPCEQTIKFYKELHKLKPELGFVLHTDSLAGHNYQFWGSETKAVLDFFLKYKK